MDVTSPEDWTALGEWLGTEHGRVDGLVNNAGIPFRARLEEVSLGDWDRVIAINLTGPLLGIQTVVPLMTDGGSIVNVSSVAGLTAHFGAAYTTSKWGLRGLSKVASLELGPRGIRVNTICPGYIETPMTASASPAFREANINETPLGRTGTVDEVAPLVLYLISDESTYVSGTEIPIDGGLSSHGGTKSMSDAVRAAATSLRSRLADSSPEPKERIPMSTVETVRGPVAVTDLGPTLMHEHIFVLQPEALQNYGHVWGESYWDEEVRVADAIEKLRAVRAAGIQTIVDPTVPGLGRYIPRIQRINAEVDLNIVVATGRLCVPRAAELLRLPERRGDRRVLRPGDPRGNRRHGGQGRVSQVLRRAPRHHRRRTADSGGDCRRGRRDRSAGDGAHERGRENRPACTRGVDERRRRPDADRDRPRR